MADIYPIRKADLRALEPLLRASFGRDDFDLQEELDALDEIPEDWFVLLEPGPQGFIRHFSVTEALHIGELYAAPGPRRGERLARLLGHFKTHHRLPPAARLRLDAPLADAELNGVLSRVPGATAKTFAHYRVRTPPRTAAAEPASFTRADLGRIQAILGVLKPYSLAALEGLARAGKLLAVPDGNVQAALHVEDSGAERLEVVTLATDPAARRRGYAFALLRKLFAKHSGVTIFLKVETTNGAATGLYERAGFVKDERKTERWWYLPLERLS